MHFKIKEENIKKVILHRHGGEKNAMLKKITAFNLIKKITYTVQKKRYTVFNIFQHKKRYYTKNE